VVAASVRSGRHSAGGASSSWCTASFARTARAWSSSRSSRGSPSRPGGTTTSCALDYFQSVEAARDERLTDAIEIVRERRRADGRWTLQNRYRGRTYFELERLGAPSRWNTLRALRVLKWWERRPGARAS